MLRIARDTNDEGEQMTRKQNAKKTICFTKTWKK